MPNFEETKNAIKDRIPDNLDAVVEKIPYADRISAISDKLPKVIGPKTHAIIDYAMAGSFLTMGALWLKSNKKAAIGSFICGGAVLANSLLTDYPGGVAEVISFETHGKIDVGLAAATLTMPRLLGLSGNGAAWFYRLQAVAETAVVGMTDFKQSEAEERLNAA